MLYACVFHKQYEIIYAFFSLFVCFFFCFFFFLFVNCYGISVCRNHNLVLSSFMTYHRFCSKCNTTGATIRVGTAYLFRAPAFTPHFLVGSHVAQYLVFLCFVDHCLFFSSFSFVRYFFYLRLLVSSTFSYIISLLFIIFTGVYLMINN
jgi:hypothetical protein